MSKLGDRVNVDKANYKPLSGLGPAMSPQEIAVEKANAAARNKGSDIKYGPVTRKGEDAHIIHAIREAASSESLLSHKFERSDADTIPKKAATTPPNKGKGTGGPSVG